jgi:hypothetical protein
MRSRPDVDEMFARAEQAMVDTECRVTVYRAIEAGRFDLLPARDRVEHELGDALRAPTTPLRPGPRG